MARKKVVYLKVSELFFDKVFEPERKKMEKKIGVGLSQRSFTEYLAKRKIQFKLPKVNNKYAPNIKKKKYKKNQLFSGGIL